MNRRDLLAGGALLLVGAPALAQTGTEHGSTLRPTVPSQHPFHNLRQGGAPHHITPEQEAQRVMDSPAPPGPPGRWMQRAAMPIPRSEMAWAAEWQGRMHVVGGYGEGRVNGAYHTVYDPPSDRWYDAAPLPRGANHVAVVAHDGRVYALGGFIQQNRQSDNKAYAYEVASDRWQEIAPLPRPRGAAVAVVLNGKVHLVAGASEPAPERASIGWHERYDPATDRWDLLRPLPGARDHVGCVSHDGVIHVVGGRFNTFQYNTGMHHVYMPEEDTWIEKAAMPTPRSGHGMVVHMGRFYCMGGEGGIIKDGKPVVAKVFGMMESYDPASDTWQSHAPMLTPRHAVGAVSIGDWIYVAGGGAVLGGAVQSAVHEAWSLK